MGFFFSRNNRNSSDHREPEKRKLVTKSTQTHKLERFEEKKEFRKRESQSGCDLTLSSSCFIFLPYSLYFKRQTHFRCDLLSSIWGEMEERIYASQSIGKIDSKRLTQAKRDYTYGYDSQNKRQKRKNVLLH